MTLEGMSVLVTGASRGIGRAIAVAAANAGAKVALTARSGDALEELATAIASAGGEAHAFPGDAGDADAIEAVVNAAADRFDGLDVLINNAGTIDPIARIDAADGDEWARALNVNLIGPTLFIRHALPYLRGRRGAVVNVSSGAAHQPLEGWAAYCSA